MTDNRKKPMAIVKTYEEGLDLMRKFALWYAEGNPRSNAWAVLVEHDDQFEFWTRTNQPCYGEMRPYATGAAPNGPYEKDLLPVSQRTVHKPGDLFSPFPKGTPVALAVPFGNALQAEMGKFGEFMRETIFNVEISPYRKVLTGFELIDDPKTGNLAGIVITDTDVDPTALVHMFRNLRSGISARQINTWFELKGKYPEVDPRIRLITTLAYPTNTNNQFNYTANAYGLIPSNANFKRIFDGDFVDHSDGGTFRQRYAYNRPKQDYLWNDGNGKSPVRPQGSGIVANVNDLFDKIEKIVR